MEPLDQQEVLSKLCKETKKWGLYISFNVYYGTESIVDILDIFKACPFLDTTTDQIGQIVCDGVGYFLFDTEEEMERHYNMCVGDDGPTELNSYDGPVRVYALTCSNEGEFMNENT